MKQRSLWPSVPAQLRWRARRRCTPSKAPDTLRCGTAGTASRQSCSTRSPPARSRSVWMPRARTDLGSDGNPAGPAFVAGEGSPHALIIVPLSSHAAHGARKALRWSAVIGFSEFFVPSLFCFARVKRPREGEDSSVRMAAEPDKVAAELRRTGVVGSVHEKNVRQGRGERRSLGRRRGVS